MAAIRKRRRETETDESVVKGARLNDGEKEEEKENKLLPLLQASKTSRRSIVAQILVEYISLRDVPVGTVLYVKSYHRIQCEYGIVNLLKCQEGDSTLTVMVPERYSNPRPPSPTPEGVVYECDGPPRPCPSYPAVMVYFGEDHHARRDEYKKNDDDDDVEKCASNTEIHKLFAHRCFDDVKSEDELKSEFSRLKKMNLEELKSEFETISLGNISPPIAFIYNDIRRRLVTSIATLPTNLVEEWSFFAKSNEIDKRVYIPINSKDDITLRREIKCQLEASPSGVLIYRGVEMKKCPDVYGGFYKLERVSDEGIKSLAEP